MWNATKNLVRSFSPGLYGGAQRVRDQLSVELRTLRQIGIGGIVQPLLTRDEWRSSLPVQRPRRFQLPDAGVEIKEARHIAGLRFVASGGHAIYLNPDQFRDGPLAELAREYPPGVGIKIVSHPGDVKTGRYMARGEHSRVQEAVQHGHGHLLLAANQLYSRGFGPRIFDVVELAVGGKVFTAYVVEDCPGGATQEQSAQLVDSLRLLVKRREIGLVIPDGFAHGDFRPPRYGDNIRCTVDGRPVYVDFQNFKCERYGHHLRRLATAAAEATHFGDRSLLQGGRYLYQSVPGVGGGKRDPGTRMQTIDSLLAQAGTGLNDRLVFDFGCNIGMMTAEYLRRGARWVHGWDLPEVIPHTERLLHAVGCSRFSLSSRRMQPSSPIEQDIPDWLRPQLKGLVVSYLALTAHFGWLDVLGRLPWDHLIFEGHEADVADNGRGAKTALAHLAGAHLAAEARYSDGHSRPRYVAVFSR